MFSVSRMVDLLLLQLGGIEARVGGGKVAKLPSNKIFYCARCCTLMAHCKLCKMCTARWMRQIVLFELLNAHCTLHTEHWKFHTAQMHNANGTVHSVPGSSAHCTITCSHCALHTAHGHTEHCTCTHWTLHILPRMVQSMLGCRPSIRLSLLWPDCCDHCALHTRANITLCFQFPILTTFYNKLASSKLR